MNKKGSGAPAAGCTRHTPAPWEQELDRNEQINIYGPDRFWIALLPHQCVLSIEQEQQRNAALIIAAPALADALLEALDDADGCNMTDPFIVPKPTFAWREQARAALRAAKRLP